jgi:hypothetical protein
MTPTEQRFWQFLRLNPKCTAYMCYAASILGRNIDVEKNFDLVDDIEFFKDKDIKERVLETLRFLTKEKREIEAPHALEDFEIRYLGLR